MISRISGSTNEEAALVRKLGAARRTRSAKERLERLQKETKFPPGAMTRVPSKRPGKHADGQA